MPHISQKKMRDQDFDKIYDQLISFFDTAGKNRKSNVLFREFMTDTEKVMFAKRMAILCLIDDGVSEHYISYILSVSPSTISRIYLRYEQGKFPYISNIIRKNKQNIWDVLEEIVRSSAERYVGPKKWLWLHEIERKYKRKILKN